MAGNENGAPGNIRPWPEVVEALPKLTRAERESLRLAIEDAGGVVVPVLALPDGRIIDGVNRWELSGGKAPVEVVDLPEGEAYDLAIRLNLERRQMSPEQVKEVQEQHRKGQEGRRRCALELRAEGATQQEAAEAVGVAQSTISEWEAEETLSEPASVDIPSPPDLRIRIPSEERPRILERVEEGEGVADVAAEYKVTARRVRQVVEQEKARRAANERLAGKPDHTPALPLTQYRCLVADPPWPVKRSERTERPDQGHRLDYWTKSPEEIEQLADPHGRRIPDLADPEGCHLYLWVTQKYLPDGLRILQAWGFEYHCLLTWVKPTGMTPFSFMFNTEHVLFGYRGTFQLERVGIKLSFEAAAGRGQHSSKPKVFYDLVRAASAGPRLTMFNRGKAPEGFEGWGNEHELEEG